MAASISLDGKVAVVTGGSRGLGEAIARLFVANGARVVIASRRQEGVAAVAESIAKEHGADRIVALAARSLTTTSPHRPSWRPESWTS